ncbi:MAG: hypothetical protein NXY59_02880 [Aigarchaeota archaeon]|nr:hypothetical protein [Candidatus Pelearchaeum maunauluense]
MIRQKESLARSTNIQGQRTIREVEVVLKDEIIDKKEYQEDMRLRSLALNLNMEKE